MKKFYSLLLVLVMAFVFVAPVGAASLHQNAPAGDIVSTITAAFLGLFGWPAFLAAGINIFKRYGLPDGVAGKVNFWANVLAWVLVAYFVFTGQTDALAKLDSALAGLAKVLVDILILTGGATAHMALTKFVHSNVKGLPLIGYSHYK